MEIWYNTLWFTSAKVQHCLTSRDLGHLRRAWKAVAADCFRLLPWTSRYKAIGCGRYTSLNSVAHLVLLGGFVPHGRFCRSLRVPDARALNYDVYLLR